MAKNQLTPKKVSSFKRTKTAPDVYAFHIPVKPVSTTKRAANSMATRTQLYVCVDDVNINGKVERIKYIKGESTIFESKMNTTNQQKSPEIVRFIDGWLYVRKEETTLLEFLRATDNNFSKEGRNTSKPKIFKEYAPERDVEKVLADEKILIRAKSYVLDKMETDEGINELLTYAKALGINTNRDLPLVEYDINQYVTKDPKGFMDGLNNPKMKRKFFVISALENDVLKIVNGTIGWTNGGAIVTTPIGQDPIDYFVDWSFGNQETFDLLKEKLLQGEPVE